MKNLSSNNARILKYLAITFAAGLSFGQKEPWLVALNIAVLALIVLADKIERKPQKASKK